MNTPFTLIGKHWTKCQIAVIYKQKKNPGCGLQRARWRLLSQASLEGIPHYRSWQSNERMKPGKLSSPNSDVCSGADLWDHEEWIFHKEQIHVQCSAKIRIVINRLCLEAHLLESKCALLWFPSKENCEQLFLLCWVSPHQTCKFFLFLVSASLQDFEFSFHTKICVYL